jgi:hypothetical protein
MDLMQQLQKHKSGARKPVAAAKAGAKGGLAAAVAEAHAPQLRKLGREPHADLRTR